MAQDDTVVGVFPDHQVAEAAVKKLAEAGIDIKHLSVVGKGYHTDEKVVGFYNAGDRSSFGESVVPSGVRSGAGSLVGSS
jgi:hypothetical protein